MDEKVDLSMIHALAILQCGHHPASGEMLKLHKQAQDKVSEAVYRIVAACENDNYDRHRDYSL